MISAIYTVMCDGFTPDNPCPAWVEEADSRKEAVRIVKNAGWTVKGRKHYCPIHSAAREGENSA